MKTRKTKVTDAAPRRWCCLFSKSQGVAHIGYLDKELERAGRNVMHQRSDDYVMLHIADTPSEASRWMASFINKMLESGKWIPTARGTLMCDGKLETDGIGVIRMASRENS